MKKRILVVEDNQDMAELLLRELEFLGHEATVARDGVEAVEMAISLLPCQEIEKSAWPIFLIIHRNHHRVLPPARSLL